MTRRTKAALERQIERLISERDREAELSAVAVARAGELEVRVAQAEAQRDAAVGRVETYHGAEIFAEQKAGHDTHDLQGCDVCRFLAGLCEHGCTIDATGQHHPGCARVIALATPPANEDYAAHLRERALNAGKTEEEMRKKYGLAPRCERVSNYYTRSDFACATHHGPFPSGLMRCPAAMTVNVTT